MDDKATTIKVFAGRSPTGIVQEELLVLPIGENKFKLLKSPGLAMDMAKDDIIELVSEESPPLVQKRGGNFCIHVYSDFMPTSEIEKLEKLVVENLRGSLDGIYEGNLTFSVPSSAGVERIKNSFDEFTRRTGIQWYYSNIYKNPQNSSDETLLNWWE